MEPLRVYLDTSVIGGCLDDVFAAESKRIFEYVKEGKLVLVVSDIVVEELEEAPDSVRDLFLELPRNNVIRISPTKEMFSLRDAYLEAKIVGEKWLDDAAHVAIATVAGVHAIVSWNFKHIVHPDKIKEYNEVNKSNGYGNLKILSPKEVNLDDRE